MRIIGCSWGMLQPKRYMQVRYWIDPLTRDSLIDNINALHCDGKHQKGLCHYCTVKKWMENTFECSVNNKDVNHFCVVMASRVNLTLGGRLSDKLPSDISRFYKYVQLNVGTLKENIAVCKTLMPPFPNIKRIGLTFDTDLWPTDLNINRGHVLIKDYLLAKFGASGAKHSWVISCTRWSRLAWPLTFWPEYQ